MTRKTLLIRAVHDAIDWNESLQDSRSPNGQIACSKEEWEETQEYIRELKKLLSQLRRG